MTRTIYYPTQEQEKSVRNWLFEQIQGVLNDGTKQKEFTFETNELNFPFDFVQATCQIRAEITTNTNYGEPQRELDASIWVKPILGIDEDSEMVIFMETKEFENLKNYE